MSGERVVAAGHGADIGADAGRSSGGVRVLRSHPAAAVQHAAAPPALLTLAVRGQSGQQRHQVPRHARPLVPPGQHVAALGGAEVGAEPRRRQIQRHRLVDTAGEAVTLCAAPNGDVQTTAAGRKQLRLRLREGVGYGAVRHPIDGLLR